MKVDQAQEAAVIESLRALEGGATSDDCLARFPEHASTLQALLTTRARMLQAVDLAAPAAAVAAGRRALLERVVSASPHAPAVWQRPPIMRLAVAFAVVFALAGGALGASAAAGVNEAQDVLSALHIVSPASQSDQQNSPSNPNASEGGSNNNDGIANAPSPAANGQSDASDSASNGSDNSNGATNNSAHGNGQASDNGNDDGNSNEHGNGATNEDQSSCAKSQQQDCGASQEEHRQDGATPGALSADQQDEHGNGNDNENSNGDGNGHGNDHGNNNDSSDYSHQPPRPTAAAQHEGDHGVPASLPPGHSNDHNGPDDEGGDN